jgi:hypothetical protein
MLLNDSGEKVFTASFSPGIKNDIEFLNAAFDTSIISFNHQSFIIFANQSNFNQSVVHYTASINERSEEPDEFDNINHNL